MPDNEGAVIHSWQVPSSDGSTIPLDARAGEVVTIVGRNGSGKSALASWMNNRASTELVRRIIAHRRVWIQSSAPDITPQGLLRVEGNIRSWNQQLNSRFVDNADGTKTDIALFSLLSRVNDENRRSADAFRSGEAFATFEAAHGLPILDRINQVLETAGLHVQISIAPDQSFLATHPGLGVSYPISQMSDGEKNAILLAAELLVAPSGVVFLVDEPERHLHRSISGALVSALVSARADCGLVVFTHDLDLASNLSERGGPTYVVSGVAWSEANPTAWDLFKVELGTEFPEDLRRAVLGGRRSVLFVEGGNDSIDRRLYGVLFSDWTVQPSGGSSEVVRNVSGLRSSELHHWIRAVGIVDGDGRSEIEVQALARRHVLSLPVAEVENLYYMPSVIGAVAAVQAATLGRAETDLIAAAEAAGVAALAEPETTERLLRKLAKDKVARQFVEYLPDEIGTNPIEVQIPSPLPMISAEIDALLAAADYEQLVVRLPIRDTSLRTRVAATLGFRTAADYEDAARVQITSKALLAESLRQMMGSLPL